MIEILPESTGNVVGARATGTLTHHDYTEILIPHLERVLKEEGKVRFLLDLGQDFEGWTLEALWDDTKFGWSSRNSFEKVALVGPSLWVELAAKAGSLFMGGEVRCFAQGHLEEAWDWIKSHPKDEGISLTATVAPTEIKAGSEEPAKDQTPPVKGKQARKTQPPQGKKRPEG